MFKKFNHRIDDLELRSCNKHLLSNDKHTTAEIVIHENDKCYTIAYWQTNKDNCDLTFIDNRIMLKFNIEDFFTLAKIGQEKLANQKEI